MGYKVNQIITNLFQGGFPPPGDGLKASGIDVLVLCAKENQDARFYPGIEVICAPGDDAEGDDKLKQYIGSWKQAAEMTADRVAAGKKVLVTCMAGLNRSGLVTAMALRKLTGAKGADIIKLIQTKREGALFNQTFVRYILSSFPGKVA
jgi:protein-tyrosine phosphatase